MTRKKPAQQNPESSLPPIGHAETVISHCTLYNQPPSSAAVEALARAAQANAEAIKTLATALEGKPAIVVNAGRGET